MGPNAAEGNLYFSLFIFHFSFLQAVTASAYVPVPVNVPVNVPTRSKEYILNLAIAEGSYIECHVALVVSELRVGIHESLRRNASLARLLARVNPSEYAIAIVTAVTGKFRGFGPLATAKSVR